MNNDKNFLLLDIPAGHGDLRCVKRENDYVFVVCYSESYHEPGSTVSKEAASGCTPVLGIAFSDVRSVDAYISALSKVSAKMKEEQK